MNLGAILCKIRGHKWRRARENEDAGMKYCQRCPVTKEIKRREAKS